ncbi:hypothetical protein [Streptosporangium sp. NPDC002524]|uniref:hypothetical protein n=1 Tax=Streptosporangium sp. NPDC002524 TaxID=3154537 RepID=UPI00331CA46B
MTDRPYYIDDELVDRRAHRLIIDIAPASSEEAGRPLYIGSCLCGQMDPTPPWDDYAVWERFDAHMSDVQDVVHRAAEQAAYISSYYDVPAQLGARVVADGKPGTIVGFDDARLLVLLDGHTEPAPHHPTWHMEYVKDDQ